MSKYPNMTIRGINDCRNHPTERWGQAVCNTFGFKDNGSLSSYVETLWEADDKQTESVARSMIIDLSIPDR